MQYRVSTGSEDGNLTMQLHAWDKHVNISGVGLRARSKPPSPFSFLYLSVTCETYGYLLTALRPNEISDRANVLPHLIMCAPSCIGFFVNSSAYNAHTHFVLLHINIIALSSSWKLAFDSMGCLWHCDGSKLICMCDSFALIW